MPFVLHVSHSLNSIIQFSSLIGSWNAVEELLFLFFCFAIYQLPGNFLFVSHLEVLDQLQFRLAQNLLPTLVHHLIWYVLFFFKSSPGCMFLYMLILLTVVAWIFFLVVVPLNLYGVLTKLVYSWYNLFVLLQIKLLICEFWMLIYLEEWLMTKKNCHLTNTPSVPNYKPIFFLHGL